MRQPVTSNPAEGPQPAAWTTGKSHLDRDQNMNLDAHSCLAERAEIDALTAKSDELDGDKTATTGEHPSGQQ